jgi:hypothetical protein
LAIKLSLFTAVIARQKKATIDEMDAGGKEEDK